eukprot:CAMPEP_0194255070 /NCGR_PEP_ID=MMETSP0158-20130606/33577_1 /TAXON_ID=33649 /ORGANISM="Thalassionema nitzschioides, Strain L26-B" /LENGTH=249 /DNA_ID=CAMNT_0038993319 /DNA_START=111 /DNA_END=857 /DNA_ORIENTATION=-
MPEHVARTKRKPQPAASKQQPFSNAITNNELVVRVTLALEKHGYGDTTLLATSLCCDEVTRDLEKAFSESYGDNFSMGGLSGIPFGGVTSFSAMAHHIPDGGSCLVVYGPHVGMDRKGNLGTVERRGRRESGPCCGSACAAASYVSAVHAGLQMAAAQAGMDMEQHFVGELLLPHANRLDKASHPQEELPRILYEENHKMIKKIVSKSCSEVAGNGKIALLGGIQINTPEEKPDLFVPMNFELLNNKGA